MPTKHGDDYTADRRLNSWQQKGIQKKILKCAIKTAHKYGKINLQKISSDSSSVRNKKGAMRQDMTDSKLWPLATIQF